MPRAAAPRKRKPAARSAPIEEPYKPQELVITLLGSYMRNRHETVWSGGLVRLLSELGFSEGAARVALTRLAARGLLTRVRRGRLIHYQLSKRGEQILGEGDQRIFSLGHDGTDADTWTVLWHEIPEAQRLERGRLARRLRFLGFGALRDGLWISPHDHEREVTAILDDLGVADRAGLMVGRIAGPVGSAALIARAWKLGDLAARYRAFATEFNPYAKRGAASSLEDREAFAIRTRMVHFFRGFPPLDPGLPDSLMPDAKQRSRAIRVFDRAYAALEPAAQRHFDATMSSWR